MDTLKAKLFIEGEIELKTGMHIGGSSTALDIGGIDANVIKTAAGVPYIPGSSLKGKMRSLIEKKRGLQKICDDTSGTNTDISKIFGLAGNKTEDGYSTRLIVRDAFLNEDDFDAKRNGLFSELELHFSESKWENTIDRTTGATIKGGLRQLERVPAGALFCFALAYSIYNQVDSDNVRVVIEGLRLLEDDYLGGSGSRGYGQIEFKNISFALKTPIKYESDNSRIDIATWTSLDQDIEKLLAGIKEKIASEATHATD